MPTTVINISLPNNLLSEADRVAKKEFRTRSDLFREALRRYIQNRSNLMEIYRYGEKKAIETGIKDETDVNRLISEYRQKK